jgi:hypothetical protein
MRKALISALLGLVLLPAPVSAWGFAAHRYITRRAIDLLPPDIKPFFLRFADELVVRAIEPDLWRTAGWEDDPNHFLDFGIRNTARLLPRSRANTVRLLKVRDVHAEAQWAAPWREAEEFGNLRRAFEDFRATGLAAQYALLFASVAGHYIQDASTTARDEQFRWPAHEAKRRHARLSRALRAVRITNHDQPSPTPPMKNPRDAAFDVLLASHQLVQPLLEADKEAIAGKDTYDDDYYEKFFAKVKQMLERQIGLSIAATAAVISGAWEQAGKPQLKTDMPRAVEKVRSPQLVRVQWSPG